MENKDIAATLEQMATLMEITGENPFKTRAHQNAARAVAQLTEPIAALIAENRLIVIQGIGKGIAEKIVRLHTTGALPEFDELRSAIPEGVMEMFSIPGLGPKKIKALWKQLGIASLGELEYACNENRLAGLRGFSEKSQATLLQGIEQYHRYQDRRLLPEAKGIAEKLRDHLAADRDVITVTVAGAIRRHCETIKGICLVASSPDPSAVIQRFVDSDFVASIVEQNHTTVTATLPDREQAMVTVITESAYPMALIEATGPEEFVAAIRERSVGIYMRHATDEESLFTALSLPFIPPELRDLYVGETARPFHEPIPSLVTEADLTGLFHCHTTWSDGAESIDTMAAACIERGYRYLGISDHSVSAHYAGGLTADDLKRQREEIDKVNESRAYFTLYHGVESDIRADGSLDYTDADLEKLDFVIASVHSGWGGKSMEEMTARLIRAIEHPATTMLGHMTGRLLLTREGYQVDVDAIIDACARTGVIIELNANPHRLDIDWHHIPKALAAGVKIAINPDAHRIAGLDHTAYGVALARKGGVTAGDVFNTLPAQQIGEALQSVRK